MKIFTFTASIQHYTGLSSEYSRKREGKGREGGEKKKQMKKEKKASHWEERSINFFTCR